MNFTEIATKALSYAKDEAIKAGLGSIGTEHLLLGLLKATDSAASRVLENNGVTYDAVKTMISEQNYGAFISVLPLPSIKNIW